MESLFNTIKNLNIIRHQQPTFFYKKFRYFHILVDSENGVVFSSKKVKNRRSYKVMKTKLFEMTYQSSGLQKAYYLHQYIWMKTRGHKRIPQNWQIHHIDGNHQNNSPSNLICIPQRIHTILDASIGKINYKISQEEKNILRNLESFMLKGMR